MPILEVKRGETLTRSHLVCAFLFIGRGVEGSEVSFKDTCKSITGKRTRTGGALRRAGRGAHPTPSPLLMGFPSHVTITPTGVLTWRSGL